MKEKFLEIYEKIFWNSESKIFFYQNVVFLYVFYLKSSRIISKSCFCWFYASVWWKMKKTQPWLITWISSNCCPEREKSATSRQPFFLSSLSCHLTLSLITSRITSVIKRSSSALRTTKKLPKFIKSCSLTADSTYSYNAASCLNFGSPSEAT